MRDPRSAQIIIERFSAFLSSDEIAAIAAAGCGGPLPVEIAEKVSEMVAFAAGGKKGGDASSHKKAWITRKKGGMTITVPAGGVFIERSRPRSHENPSMTHPQDASLYDHGFRKSPGGSLGEPEIHSIYTKSAPNGDSHQIVNWRSGHFTHSIFPAKGKTKESKEMHHSEMPAFLSKLPSEGGSTTKIVVGLPKMNNAWAAYEKTLSGRDPKRGAR